MSSSDSSSRAVYGVADRFLHRVGLGSRAVLETSFDMERAMFGKAATARTLGPPVFVCGLARAGTSLVTRLLAASGEFAFPSYRDLPFPLAPNLWSRLSGGRKRTVAASERGHGDGLTHDLDSPEAVEEAFWRCFEGDRYIEERGLLAVPPGPETIPAFRRYVALIALQRGAPRYLSKNNNNLLRLPALLEAFPDAVIVHPFRHPARQAESLLRQHLRARALSDADGFRGRYMAWLGHHEFGADHRPFVLPDGPAQGMDPGSIDYWLASWRSAYGHLLRQPPEVRARQCFLDYDRLCAAPDAAAAAIARAAGITAVDPALVRVSATATRSGEDGDAIYRALLARAGEDA